jgi:hypothetical protein
MSPNSSLVRALSALVSLSKKTKEKKEGKMSFVCISLSRGLLACRKDAKVSCSRERYQGVDVFSVEHTSALHRAVVEEHLIEVPDTGRLNCLGGGSNRLGQGRRQKPRLASPGGTPSGIVRLGLSSDQHSTQNFLNHRGDEGGEKLGLEKLGFRDKK